MTLKHLTSLILALTWDRIRPLKPQSRSREAYRKWRAEHPPGGQS